MRRQKVSTMYNIRQLFASHAVASWPMKRGEEKFASNDDKYYLQPVSE